MFFFCQYTGSVDGKAAPALHSGGDAIRALITFCEQNLSKKPSTDELETCSKAFDLLDRYSFMCPPGREDARKQVLKFSHGGAAEPKAKAKGKAKAAKSAPDSAVRSAKALFDE